MVIRSRVSLRILDRERISMLIININYNLYIIMQIFYPELLNDTNDT